MRINKLDIKWLDQPEEQDYPAAESYLNLIYQKDQVIQLLELLRAKTNKITFFKAKDIFRASGLSLLGVSNSHVEKNRKKIKKGKALSPILLIRDTKNGKVVIADGYHRLCTIYGIDEDAVIPCKIV